VPDWLGQVASEKKACFDGQIKKFLVGYRRRNREYFLGFPETGQVHWPGQ
jgi:hypothetical protein